MRASTVMQRLRADELMVRLGLARDRAEAAAFIMAGRVRVQTARVDKPGSHLPADTLLSVDRPSPWVGRGALKLLGAIESLKIEPSGKDALDVGASTGGFTEVLLAAGARRVVALDVGRGQLAWRLRRDPRVHVLEGFHARRLEPSRLPFRPQLATVDVSFISLELVLPPIVDCLAPDGEIVALVKPQFEAPRSDVGPGGIVREQRVQRAVLERIARFAIARGWALPQACRAAIPGSDGNQEYFVHLRPFDPPGDLAALEPLFRSCLAEPGADR
jgi:23S rRNA (cytidine1920-2'-O)/16S rRNA (cytidine1409-2'-O)-methyltransferase